MDEQKTLLEQIRDKESELNKRLELAGHEADRIVSAGKEAFDKVILTAEATGQARASEHFLKEKAGIDREAEEIKARGAREARDLHEAGEKNLPKAVDWIVKTVEFEFE
jgi:V/A-type H+/Na+-transporting ATPase subunit G/H